ncbi:hypothetical protein [Clostridium sp. YIM B02551]|uniref:hypothetical protein n=1 Tax=Clostridium sp. YIM B02551 TaxID=2910679 RepID=UPI001EECC71A|nr:hypothetical protein [Clostridium sp. YIM B02551]
MSFWYFPSNDHGENKGINDSGVSMFRGTPLKSLAREICQNSLDAATQDTVKIEFSVFKIAPSALPGCDNLKNTFEKCIDFWGNLKAKTTKDFFENAIDKISAGKIEMLRISDFNTTGLKGSKEVINTDWTNLTKSSGTSDKKGTAGGSYGIGKFAPFACSEFSTVFYSTYDIEGIKANQGVSRLVTFRRDDDETTQGIGYYGDVKNTPVFETLDLDPKFTRNDGEYGTDVFIAGYKYAGDDWQDKIIISIIDGFLGAIWKEKLIVNVGGIVICKDTLDELMETYRDDITGYADKYYKVLTSNKTNWHEEDFMGLGTIKFGVLLGGQEMHRKVAMIRQTGMKIMDRDRLSGYIPFAAVMFIEGDKINEELRLIENPEHTEWQPERSQNPIRAQQLVKALNDYMKNCIEKLVSQGQHGEMDAVGVGSLLPDEVDITEEASKEEVISDKVAEIEKTIIKKQHKEGNIPDTPLSEDLEAGSFKKDGEDVNWFHQGGKHDNSAPRPGVPAHGTKGETDKVPVQKEILPEKFISICLDKSKGKYIILFVPSSNGKDGEILINLSGETQSYEAPIKDATLIGGDKLIIERNKIKNLDFIKGKPLRINVELDYSDYCSMEVSAYANKK